MNHICVVTFARSEYNSCLPILKAIQADSGLNYSLIVAGSHLSSEFGCTIREIEADGFDISDRAEMVLSSDTPSGIAKSIGLGVMSLAQSLARIKPEILLVVGDRLELLSLAVVALPLNIPLAHVSGGDISEGAIDNQVRNAMTKLSHIHFVAMPEHARRLIQMGEESWRVFVTGDPALDLIEKMKMLTRNELSTMLSLELKSPILLVTYHPTTLGSSTVLAEVNNLLAALEQISGTLIFIYPCADAESRAIIARLKKFVVSRSNTKLFFNLDHNKYYSLLNHVDLMIGNSSSGFWEAPSFHLPVVNIGARQKGRLRPANIIDVTTDVNDIYQGIKYGLSSEFRASLKNLQNPWGDGHAALRIVSTLKDLTPNFSLLRKKFIDLNCKELADIESK